MARIAPVRGPAPHRPGADVPALPRRHATPPGSSRSAARGTARSGCNVALGPGDRRGGIEYCCIDETAAMVWAANMAAIEIHAPMALAADLDTPRAMVFDFDPGAPATIVECCVVACAARDVLAAVGLEGWCKTSGSKGLQMYVPLNTAGADARGRRRLRAGGRSGARTPAHGPGHDRDGQGQAPRQDLRRLEPERPPQDDDRPVLAAGPRRADRVDPGRVGRGRGVRRRASSSCGSPATTCWNGSTELGDLFEPVLTAEQELPALGG